MTLLERRVLGFRSLDVGLFIFLLVLILGVYLAKTMAGGERGQIAAAERQIAEEQDRIVLLEAEVAHLERPERLSAIAGLAPVASAREITPKGLADALQSPASVVPQLVVVAAPVVPTAAEAETSTVIEETTADPAAREPKP
jgi:hypothetical protein